MKQDVFCVKTFGLKDKTLFSWVKVQLNESESRPGWDAVKTEETSSPSQQPFEIET